MSETERLQRYKDNEHLEFKEKIEFDEALKNRIQLLLNDPKIDKYCMVDAYYYDFSVIPREIQEKLNLWRDVYLIFGINFDGEIVSKWVDRYDLDSTDEIVDGKVIHVEKKFLPFIEITQKFDPNLLSTPTSDLTNYFLKRE